jgi:hypothetical protein
VSARGGPTETLLPENEAAEQYIEFDHQQLTLRSNSPEIQEFVRQTFRRMLASGVDHSVGQLEVFQHPAGFTLRGRNDLDFPGTAEKLANYLKHEVHFHFIESRSDLFWLHAGAAERNGKALLLSGPSGCGKSTLTTLLCGLGWKLMSDDMAPMRMSSLEVLAYPQSPIRRLDSGIDIEAHGIGTLEREPIEMSETDFRREPAAVGAIVFPSYKRGAKASIHSLSQGEGALEVIRNCTNFAELKDTGVTFAATLCASVPVYRLAFGGGQKAVSLLDDLL